MNKLYLCAILGACMLTGCGSKEVEHVSIEGNVMSKTAQTEESMTAESQEIESVVEQTTNETQIVVEGTGEESPAKEIFDQYKDDLLRLSFIDAEGGQIEVKDDYFVMTDGIIYEKYYLDAAYVESLKAGDTIDIQDITYQITTMEWDDYGYHVQLETDEEADWDNGKYVYYDIYRLAPTEDKQHYIVYFCSDDIVQNKVYEGPIYLAKDATINGYFGDEIKDGTIEEYLNQEYPYISALEFTVDENTGFVTSIQNQIAG